MCGCVYSKGIKEVYGCLSSTGETSMLHKYQKYQKYQRKRRRREEEATVRKLQTISLQPQICVSTYTLLQSLTFLKYKSVLFCFLIINKSYEKTKTSNELQTGIVYPKPDSIITMNKGTAVNFQSINMHRPAALSVLYCTVYRLKKKIKSSYIS